MKRPLFLFAMLGLALWGNAQGPELIKDIYPGFDDGFSYNVTDYLYQYIAEFDGRIFFAAEDGIHGVELWATDGSEAGTVMIKDINEGPEGSACQKFYSTEDFLFFVAFDEEHGNELWRTDGTEAGTIRLKDISPGTEGSMYVDYGWENEFYVWGGVLYFGADDGQSGKGLWRSDGTEAGTYLLKDLPGGFPPYYFAEHDGHLYFSANYALWVTDGSEAGTVIVTDQVDPSVKISCNGYLLFMGDDDFYNYEPWRSDGTEAGTVKIKEINPTSGSFECGWSDEEKLIKIGDVIFFSADDGTTGTELWRSDGTETGTYLLKDLVPGTSGGFYELYRDNIIALGNQLIFGAGYNTSYNKELWRSDGTEAGTIPVDEIRPGSQGSDPFGFKALGDEVIFIAETNNEGAELWKYQLPTSTLELPEAIESFKLVPSLTSGQFAVVFLDKTNIGPMEVKLFSTTGTPLKLWSDVVSGQELDVYDIPAGMYFVQISDEKGGIGVRTLVVGF